MTAALEPAVAHAPPPPPKQLLEAFEGPIAPVPVPVLYRVALFGVAVVMVLLPLLYVGLIAGAAYGLYWYATGPGLALFSGRGGGQFRLLLYLTPLVAGGILVLFMVKPLFARRAAVKRPRALDPGEQPLLFAFVKRIASAVGSPVPSEIRVDCEVNASAGFRNGAFSLFTNELVLTIGLPLVAGLEVRQLAGVLGHEFGHFAQGTGMRVTYVIRSVNGWFARVVFERDAWDEWLDRTAKETDLRIGVVLHVARGMVWLTRKILWALMMAGHTVSCFMLRQMELDADRYEARLSGSETFERTARALPVLNVAAQRAHSGLSHAWTQRQLGDNYPELVAANVAKLPPDTLAALEKALAEGETGFFDTHPCDRERIASAHREATAGVFRPEAPASAVFRHFDHLCQEVTRDYYQELIGEEVKPETLVPTRQVLALFDALQASAEALGRYFAGAVRPDRPLWPARTLPELGAGLEPRHRLEAARATVEAHRAKVSSVFERIETAKARHLSAARASALTRAGYTFEAKEFNLHDASSDGVDLAKREAANMEADAVRELAPVDEAQAERLLLALACAGKTNEATRREVEALFEVLERLERAQPELTALREVLAGAEILLINVQAGSVAAAAGDTFEELSGRARKGLAAIRSTLAGVTSPLASLTPGKSLADYVCAELPSADGATLGAADNALDAAHRLYVLLMGRLVELAEGAERALGLEPLRRPEP